MTWHFMWQRPRLKNHLEAPLKANLGINPGRNAPLIKSNDKNRLPCSFRTLFPSKDGEVADVVCLSHCIDSALYFSSILCSYCQFFYKKDQIIYMFIRR